MDNTSDATHVVNQFSDMIEKTISNAEIMRQGREAVDFYKSIGLIRYPERVKPGRVHKDQRKGDAK